MFATCFQGYFYWANIMARNRMIKPEFFSDEKISKLPFEARLLFIGMWNFADDCGVIHNNPRKLLGEIFPNDEKIRESQIKKWVLLLLNYELIVELEYNSGSFLRIKNWDKHQIVPNPSKKQWIPNEILEGLISKKIETNESLIRENSIKDKDKDKDKDNVIKINDVPKLSEFISYAKTLSIYHTSMDFQIEAKYNAWVENGWKDGNDKKIKNWRTKLQNTIPYFRKGNDGRAANQQRRKDYVTEDEYKSGLKKLFEG